MSYRDVFWFFAGAAAACAAVGVILAVRTQPAAAPVAGSAVALPQWHPPVGVSKRSPDLQSGARADELRRARNYEAARAAYAQMAANGEMSADAWADYADVVASVQQGSLAGEPARLIEEALRAAPDHPKALWLKASLAHQERRYADALVVWRALLAQLSPDSPDRRIITANMEEAASLAGQAAPTTTLSIALGRELH